MYPQSHFLFSWFVGLVFVKFGVIDYRMALFVAFAGMLVDVDHYVDFLAHYKYKDFSFKDAWNRAVKGLYEGRTFIHHELGVAMISLLFVAIYFVNNYWFWILALGYYSHLILDFGHFNILKIREKMTVREAGFVMKINKFEVLFDIFMVVVIVLMVW